MLFAAGLGNRMRHLTKNSPKSLIPILGKPILHYALEMCCQHNFKKIIINTHYIHTKINESIREFQKLNPDCPEIITIYEEELLETGGAIKNAQKLIGNGPLFTMNTDVILKSDANLFQALEVEWDPNKMEFLLLMQPTSEAIGYTAQGDFELQDDGRISRPDIQGDYKYVYAGLEILNPERVFNNPLKIFSLREYYLNGDKIYGTVVSGTKWYHASSPEDLVDIEVSMLAHEKM